MKKGTYKISSSLMLQIIDDEALLMDTNTQQFYELNEGGVVLWKIMKEHNSFNNVIDDMLEAYEVSKEQVQQDLEVFISYLIKHDLLKINESI